jgi:hypothetical protein
LGHYETSGAWELGAAHHGLFNQSAYVIEGTQLELDRHQVNGRSRERSFSARLKQHFSPADSIYLEAIATDRSSGDLAQYFDPASSRPTLRIREEQLPIPQQKPIAKALSHFSSRP